MKRLFALFFTLITLAAPVAADPVEGPRRGAGVLESREADAYTIVLRGDETTIFAIVGDNRGGDIDCALYDGRDNLVATDTRSADECRIAITPAWTGMFRLLFVNVGDAASIYVTRIY